MSYPLQNKPVFLTLLVFGLSVLGATVLFNLTMRGTFWEFLIGIVIGMGIGGVTSFIEISWWKTKNGKPYSPSVVPAAVFVILILLNQFVLDFKIAPLNIAIGAYLVAMAFLFRLYEIETRQKSITWKELKDRQNIV